MYIRLSVCFVFDSYCIFWRLVFQSLDYLLFGMLSVVHSEQFYTAFILVRIFATQLFNVRCHNTRHLLHYRHHYAVAKLPIGLSVAHRYFEVLWETHQSCALSWRKPSRTLSFAL